MADDALLTAPLRVGALDARFFALLSAIESTGSINRAARTVGLSYKGAWLLLDQASNFAHEPLLVTAAGGARGGGTRLTPTAHELLAAWTEIATRHRRFLAQQEQALRAHPRLATLVGSMRMKSTARNQFLGTILRVEIGPVSAQVTLALKGGPEITATLTSTAARELKLKKGLAAIALVKASSIVLMADMGGYRLSARNQLEGTVSRIEKGAVSSLVVLTLPGGTKVSATVTNDAVEALALKVGQAATAVFKAYSVIVGVKA